MNKFISLTKVIVKCGFGESTSFASKKNQSKKKSINGKLMAGLLTLCMIPVFAVMIISGKSMFEIFSQLGQVNLGYQTIICASSMFLLVFAIPYVMSVFFMSSDIHTLMALPIKPSMILGAKFTSIILWQYLVVGVFAAPMLIGFSLAAGVGIVGWLLVVVTILTMALTPTVYASFFAIILARVLKNFKNKEMISTMSTMVVIFAAVGISLFTQNAGQNSDMMASLASQSGLITGMSYVFPNSFLLSKSLETSNVLYMMFYLLTVVAIVAIFLFIGEKLYIGGASSMGEHSGNRKTLTLSQKNKISTKRSPVSAIVNKEFKTLFRSPEYFLNCLLMPIIMPVIMIGITGFSAFSAMKQAGASEGAEGFDLAGMISASSGEQISGILLIVCLGIAFIVSSMNMATVTCISREGKGFVNMKYIPISYKTQIKGKLIAGEIIGLATVLPVPVILLVGGTIALKLNPMVVLLGLIGTIMAFAICNYFQMLLDLFSPKLSWETEQGAVKQNFNTFISIMVLMISGGLVCTGIVFAFNSLNVSVMIFASIVVAVLTAIAFLMRVWVYKYGEKKLANLE